MRKTSEVKRVLKRRTRGLHVSALRMAVSQAFPGTRKLYIGSQHGCRAGQDLKFELVTSAPEESYRPLEEG